MQQCDQCFRVATLFDRYRAFNTCRGANTSRTRDVRCPLRRILASQQAAIVSELHDMWTDFEPYMRDVWNILDVIGLYILAGAFIVRVVDDLSPWGQALYALSAPLVFSRVLFFAQILRFQGPMVQVGLHA